MHILLRMRSVATDLVTSQKFQPLRCAFMLCQFGQTRNVYVATKIILLSSTAESSATSDYVAVPEHFPQNEVPACTNEERTMKKPSFVPKVNIIDAIVSPSMYLCFSTIVLVYFRRTPDPFREYSGAHTWKTRERMRTTPRMILILKQASCAAGLHRTLAQKTVVTWWQELQGKIATVVIWLQELQYRIGTVVTWWQDLQKRIGTVVTWWHWVQGEIRCRPDMLTAVQEEIPYCSSGISSRRQKKARSTNQLQFRSENTPVTIETDQILLALQQLATNSISANVNNNSNRISKLPKSLTITMPAFDGNQSNLNCLKIYSKRV